MPSQVECLSEFQYAQRPIALTWEGARLQVKEVLSSWRTPDGWAFRVLIEDGRTFELCYNDFHNAWDIQPL